MINRSNYHDVKRYLAYHEEVRQSTAATVRRCWAQLRHLLEWADEIPFPRASSIRPTFPVYLAAARNDGRAEPLAPSTVRAACGAARGFFRWTSSRYPRRYRPVAAGWIDTVRAPRGHADGSEHEFFGIEDVLEIVALPVDTLTDLRDQAAIAFLFAAGLRVGAFVTLPVCAVDLEDGSVKQWTRLGVKTKNRKSATTYLLEIPELLGPIGRWDRLVRESLPSDALWYATLTRDGMSFAGGTSAGKGRRRAVTKGLMKLCRAAGVPYRSPHKLRHGHTVYALKRAGDVATAKAVSQNLMHQSLTTTESIYGALAGGDVQSRIRSLTRPGQVDAGDDVVRADEVVARLLTNSGVFVDALADAVASRLRA